MSNRQTVLTAIGADRPGIVDRVSSLIHDAGGNIEDSRMAILGGDFALILLFTGGAPAVARVRRGMVRAARALRLTYSLKSTRPRGKAGGHLVCRLRVTGLDHPGIVHRVGSVLAGGGVNVASLDTHVSEAPESGAPVFVLTAELQVPLGLPVAELRAGLQRACDAEALDFSLDVRS